MAYEEEIAKLEEVLNSGATRVSVDGVDVSYDLEAIRRRLGELKRKQNATKRPRVAAADLSGS
jgi:hypothetical protein